LAGAVSHELRTTLALISGYGQSLLHLPLDDDTRRRYLERMLAATEVLAEFADQIVSVAVPDETRPVLRRRPVALEWLVARLARELDGELAHAQIRYQQTRELPLVDADPAWIGHVLRNLVRNSLQHGNARVIAINARMRDGAVVLTVRDDGPGFDPDERDLVFGAFYRGRHARASRPDGLGFGLYLCRELVEAHGGHIWIEDSARGGAVSLSLPTCQSTQGAREEMRAGDAPELSRLAAAAAG
ncbi:MAG: HAMP domain-containing histidine kinase, partial [Acidobacteriota bacterium]|nr:HAMP domain-containing histidine kinase [Acidobacteriota bacterium]